MKLFSLVRIFEQLALALKNRECPEFFTVLKYSLSFRIFEQLALVLKNRVCPEMYHCIEYTFTFRIFEQIVCNIGCDPYRVALLCFRSSRYQ